MAFRVLVTSTLLALSWITASPAQAKIKHDIDIPAQDLGSALALLARQTRIQVVYSTDLVEGRKAHALSGSMTAEEALEQLLDRMSLKYEFIDAETVTLSTPGAGATSPRSEDRARQPVAAGSTETAKVELEEIVVTGTHVKGAKDTFSPTLTIDRESMDRAGFGTVYEALERLPQNFGGGTTPDTSPAGDARGAGAASVNLRGLGDGATLILLNGHRLAPGGAFGDFVDISTIPSAAIDRIEVVTDGASAIYGSDAIAGVVNIILRKDFEGAESRLSWNTITDGGSDTIRAGQTLGWSGQCSHGLISYEYASEDLLAASDKDFARTVPERTYLLPENRKHNVLVSTGVELSDRVSLSADGYFGRRQTRGSWTSDYDWFGYTADLEVEQLSASLGVNARLFGDWQADVSGGFSRSTFNSDSLMSPPPENTGTKADSSGEVLTFDASAGGSLFRLGSESVRGVIGMQYRDEQIDQLTFNRLNPSIVHVDRDKQREVLAAYGEIYAPLVTAADGVPGVHRLAMSLAARYEDYSDVGTTFDPRIGVAWSPVASLSLRGTYGTAFRAPRLDQLIDNVQYVFLAPYADAQSPTGQSTALVIGGSTPNLTPEEAVTWTVGLDFTPAALPGLSVRASYFDIDYDDRVGIPFLTLNSNYQYTQFAGVPVRNPSQETVQSLVGRARVFRDFSTQYPIDPLSLADVSVLLDTRAQNLSLSKAQGVDLDVQYELPTDAGRWTFFVNSTFLTDFSEQVSPRAPVTELLNTYNNPVDLRVRLGAAWQTQRATAALYVNYVDDYSDNQAVPAPVSISSWTTVDASLRFNLGEVFARDLARNAFVTFNVLNLLNEDPPRLGPSPVRGAVDVYDNANADPAGRRIGILLSKQW